MDSYVWGEKNHGLHQNQFPSGGRRRVKQLAGDQLMAAGKRMSAAHRMPHTAMTDLKSGGSQVGSFIGNSREQGVALVI